MKHVKLLVLAAFAMLALGAVASAVASAETPQFLCLVKGCAKTFSMSLATEAGGLPFLESLAGNKIESTSATTTLKGCTPEGAEEKDFTLCPGEVIEFKGVKASGTACNTEGDAKEVALVPLDLHLASELNAAGTELEPLLLARISNGKGEAGTLKLKCAAGLVIIEVKGTVGCLLLPGLKEVAAGGMLELLCKINTTTHDPESGKCELLCEWLEKEPLLSKIGEKFEDAWENIHLLGLVPESAKDVFIDD